MPCFHFKINFICYGRLLFKNQVTGAGQQLTNCSSLNLLTCFPVQYDHFGKLFVTFRRPGDRNDAHCGGQRLAVT